MPSGSEEEWDLPQGAISSLARQESNDGEVDAAVTAEMSERELKKWLQRFANDGSTKALDSQWHYWAQHNDEAEPKVSDWLLRRGLDDCLSAQSVAAVFQHLLLSGGLSMELAEGQLAEYSEEALEDIALDNPRAGEFVTSLRASLAEVQANPPAVPVKVSPPASVDKKPTANGTVEEKVEAHSYDIKTLMKAREWLLEQEEEPADKGLPRWHTELATQVGGATPAWATRLAEQEENPNPKPKAEWRDAQRRSSDRRGDEARGKKGGGGSRQKEAPLQVSDTSWAAITKKWKQEVRQEKPTEDDAVVDEVFVRDMRAALNKLTIEKFEKMSEAIIGLIAKSTRPNRGIPMLMQLVFEKATTQHHFIGMYVNLCVKLHLWLTEREEKMAVESQSNFKRILLNQCQSSFEQYLEPPDGFEGLQDTDLYEAQVKYKTRMLGNIKLVGQLIRHGMLAPRIAIAVAAELARDDPIVRDERLETLAVFLETVGPSLDDTSWSHYTEFDNVFTQVKEAITDKRVACRIRFLLRDVADLRAEGWKQRQVKELGETAPMTLAQVHQKAKLDNMTPSANKSRQQDASAARRQEDNRFGSLGAKRKSAAERPFSLQDVGESAQMTGSSPAASSQTGRDDAPAGGSWRTPKGTPTHAPAASPSTPREPWRSRVGGAPPKSPSVGPGSGKPPQSPLVGPGSPKMEASGEKSSAELLKVFRREMAQTMKQLGQGLEVGAAVKRLHSCPLPSGCSLDESVDLIARMVDEPRARRRQLFPLISTLFSEGIFSPPKVLRQAVESFMQDALADPGCIDPPDLPDILVRELLPALGISPGQLTLPPCVSELVETADDRS